MKEIKISVRFTQEDYELIKKCADLDRRSVSDFIRCHALNSAEQFIKEKGAKK